MSNVLVREVPEQVHERLRALARAQGKSLQQYLLEELEQLASRPSMAEVLDRIASRSGGRIGLDEAALGLAAERERR